MPTNHTQHNLVHLSDELVDVALPITEVTTLDVVLELSCPPSPCGVRQLERPQEVRGLSSISLAEHTIFIHHLSHTCLKLGPAVMIS